VTTQLTQGQQRLKTVNRVSIGLFFMFLILGELYFLLPIGTADFSIIINRLTMPLSFLIPIAVLMAYYLRKVIKTIYVRETVELAKGCYTERSWLDIDDKVLVSVEGNDVSFFEIPEYQLNDVQSAYQQRASFDTLIETAGVKRSKVVTIAMAAVEKMTSSHKKDTIEVEIGEDYHSLEFLNVKMKNHALTRFQLLLNDKMIYRKTKPSRLRATLPWLITIIIFALIMFLIHNPYVWALLFGIGFFMILPKMLRELIDPTQLEIWELPEEESSK
jgi:hypothetical protein